MPMATSRLLMRSDSAPMTMPAASVKPSRPHSGAGLIGLAPLWGLLGFTLAAGIVMGALSDRISNRDVAIGIVLALALGFGLLFLHYYTSFATQATALLFGNVLAVDHQMIATLAVLGAITLGALAAIMRPLIFATLQP